MILLMKVYAQFHPSNAFDVTAVVDANRKTPVRAVDVAKAPFRPNLGIWTSAPPIKAPGTPSTAMMAKLRYVMYVDPSPNAAPRVAWI